MDNLLEHLTAERFKCEVGIVAQLQQICYEQAAVKTAAPTAQVKDAALKGIATRIKNADCESVQVHLLLIEEEKVKAWVRRVRLPSWQSMDARICLLRHIYLFDYLI